MHHATVIKLFKLVSFLDENNQQQFTRDELSKEVCLCKDSVDNLLCKLLNEGKIKKAKRAQVCLYFSNDYIEPEIEFISCVKKQTVAYSGSVAQTRRPIITNKVYQIDKKMADVLSRCNLHTYYSVPIEEVFYYAE